MYVPLNSEKVRQRTLYKISVLDGTMFTLREFVFF